MIRAGSEGGIIIAVVDEAGQGVYGAARAGRDGSEPLMGFSTREHPRQKEPQLGDKAQYERVRAENEARQAALRTAAGFSLPAGTSRRKRGKKRQRGKMR